MRRDGPVKLVARDADDISIVSALLQDAVVSVGDMRYLPDERRFVLVANRFRWDREARGSEPEPGDAPVHERVHCGVFFDKVTAVRHVGVDRRRRSRILSLLALRPGEGRIDLVFAAGAAVRLETEEVLCHLEDFGEPWPTRWRPGHPLEEPR